MARQVPLLGHFLFYAVSLAADAWKADTQTFLLFICFQKIPFPGFPQWPLGCGFRLSWCKRLFIFLVPNLIKGMSLRKGEMRMFLYFLLRSLERPDCMKRVLLLGDELVDPYFF